MMVTVEADGYLPDALFDEVERLREAYLASRSGDDSDE